MKRSTREVYACAHPRTEVKVSLRYNVAQSVKQNHPLFFVTIHFAICVNHCQGPSLTVIFLGVKKTERGLATDCEGARKV